MTVKTASKPTQSAEQRFVTPRMAADELDMHNNMNREIRASEVDALAAKMESGQWADNGATVTYDTAGEIVDGQHRYAAIIKSGVGQWLWIITGLKPDARTTVDDGRKRTFADDLAMNGVSRARDLEALTRKVLTWERFGGLARNSARRVMRDDIARKFNEVADKLTEAYDVAHDYPRIPMSLANKAFLYWLLRQHADEKLIRQFFSILSIGSQFEKDEVVVRLRDKMLSDRGAADPSHRGNLASRHMYFTIRTWNAWVTGENLGKFQAPVNGITNPFPSPVSVQFGETR